MLPIALSLAFFVGALALVSYLRVRSAARAFSRIVEFMDRSTRRVGIFAALPGVVAAGWLYHRGIAPGPALIVGVLAAFGAFAVSLSILKMEGMLTETESAAALRIAAGRPAPSTALGRVVWTVIGLVLIAVCLAAVRVVST